MKRLLEGLAGLIVGALATVYALRDGSSPPVTAAAVSESAADARLESLERRMSSLAASKATLDRADVQTPRVNVGDQHEPLANPNEDNEALIGSRDPEVQATRYFDELERQRGLQQQDVKWERDIAFRATSILEEAAVHLHGAPTLDDSAIEGVECGSTLCKLSVEHDSVDAQERFSQWFLSGMRLNASLRKLDGRTVIYLAREGHLLPSMDLVLDDSTDR